jgi:hypothetical protein
MSIYIRIGQFVRLVQVVGGFRLFRLGNTYVRLVKFISGYISLVTVS